jgi:hypothetical protein
MFDPSNKLKNFGLNFFGSAPPELVGQWMLRNPGNGSLGFRIFADGKYYIALNPIPYNLSSDGNTLNIDYGSDTYNRLSLYLSNSLLGHWRNNNSNRPDILFDNGAHYEFDKDGRVYVSSWGISNLTGIDTLTLWPLRATVIVSSDKIRYHPIYWTESAEVTYSISDAQLSIFLDDGTRLTYDKVPFASL